MMEDSGEKLSDDDKAPVNEKLDELEGLIMNEGQPIDFEELDDIAKSSGISLQQRPQEISPQAWVRMANKLIQIENDAKKNGSVK